MARGYRREAIARDDGGHHLFLKTFGEACGRTGWEAPPLEFPIRAGEVSRAFM